MADWDAKLIEGGPSDDFRLYEVRSVDLSVPQEIPIPCAGFDLARVSYHATGPWTSAVVSVGTSNNQGRTIDTFPTPVVIGGATVTRGATALLFLCDKELHLRVTTAEAGAKADFWVLLKR